MSHKHLDPHAADHPVEVKPHAHETEHHDDHQHPQHTHPAPSDHDADHPAGKHAEKPGAEPQHESHLCLPNGT